MCQMTIPPHLLMGLMLWPYSGLAFCSILMRFLAFFLGAGAAAPDAAEAAAAAAFLAADEDDLDEEEPPPAPATWQLASGGSCRRWSSISSAARFLEVWKKNQNSDLDDESLF